MLEFCIMELLAVERANTDLALAACFRTRPFYDIGREFCWMIYYV